MRAVRFHNKEDVRLEVVPVPIPGRGQVRLRPRYVGICGTGMLHDIEKRLLSAFLTCIDVHEYTRGATLIPKDAHPLTGQTLPVTLGHEISGIIDAVGPGVRDRSAGDRVAIFPILADGDCHACEQGRPNCCLRQSFYGLSASVKSPPKHSTNHAWVPGANGGLADYMIVEAASARSVPVHMSLELASTYGRNNDVSISDVVLCWTHTSKTALVEPLAVGWHAVRTNLSDKTTSALVIGAGPIGLAIVQALKAHGVEFIVVADTNPKKKEYASRAGAHHFIESLKENVVEATVGLFGHAGVKIAFDTAGKQVTLDQCVNSLCVGGTVVNVAIWGGSASIFPNAFALGEKRYVGSAVYVERDFDEVISAISTGIESSCSPWKAEVADN